MEMLSSYININTQLQHLRRFLKGSFIYKALSHRYTTQAEGPSEGLTCISDT
jgi:hypothetical protein